jgi:hypothetical protein
MGTGTRIGRGTASVLVAAAATAVAAFLMACASSGGGEEERSPGMYNLTGWNSWGADVNGEVGHRLYVAGPTALCHPSRNWTADSRVASGQLPPGMTLNKSDNIEGVPTERGHWIVTLELDNVTCQGSSYKGITQELRFHITGSGRVVQ